MKDYTKKDFPVSANGGANSSIWAVAQATIAVEMRQCAQVTNKA